MSEPILTLEMLSKTFDRLTAVDKIDLQVQQGEILGFLGPNGAGKTTTIKMIAGLLQPSSGAISICGHDMASEAKRCRELTGYIPDRPFLYEKLTGAEYLSFISSLYPPPQGKTLPRRHVEKSGSAGEATVPDEIHRAGQAVGQGDAGVRCAGVGIDGKHVE